MQILFDDIGRVKVGETVLPGIFESMEIHGSVRMDQVDIPGKEQKVTQAVGYDNARIRLTVNLLPPEDGGGCEQQIAVYQSVFRKSPDQEKPGVYRIVNPHTIARGINEVIFADLKTWEDNRSDKVLVICEFIEHVPIQVKVKQQSAPKPASASSGGQRPAQRPAGQAQQPKATGMGDLRRIESEAKTAATPAKDAAEPGLARRILNWIKGDK